MAKVSLQFQSKRFLLRPYKFSDYGAWRSAYSSAFPKQNDFDLEKKSEADLSPAQFKKFLALNQKHEKNGDIYHLGVFERRTGRLMGFVLFALITRFNVQSARISYTVFNNYWKHGYGKEIVGAALQFAFKKLKLHRLEAEILPGNRASIALAKALGFQCEGIRRGAVFFDHKWHDHLVYAILAEDVGVKKMRPSIFN